MSKLFCSKEEKKGKKQRLTPAFAAVDLLTSEEDMSREIKDIKIDLMADGAIGKVVFAEVEVDFLDVLFSFLTVHPGTIHAIHDRKSNIGCIDSLIQSVTDLQMYLKPSLRSYLLFPKRDWFLFPKRIGKYYCFCQNRNCRCCTLCNCGVNYYLKKKVEQNKENGGDELWFFKKESSKFVITDELVVKPITRNSSSFSMLSIIDIHLVGNNTNFKRVTITVKHDQVVDLFKRSLVSVSPLSDVFFPLVPTEDDHKPKIANHIKSRSAATCTISQQRAIETISNGKNITIKLICDKINKRVLFAEAKEDFVELLFVFLQCSLRFMVHSLSERCPFISLYNLYQSARDLDMESYYKSENHKLYFEDRKYLIDLFEEKIISDGDRFYLHKKGLFIVTDDLQVTPFSITSSLNMFGKFNISMEGIEDRVVSVDKEKAMKLFMGFLTSNMALTDAFLK